jgi:tetratricopeptide (TPR) repeat protein
VLAVAYFNSGFAHYEAKRYAEAVADFSQALEINQPCRRARKLAAGYGWFCKVWILCGFNTRITNVLPV